LTKILPSITLTPIETLLLLPKHMENLRYEGLERLRLYINSMDEDKRKAFEAQLGTTINYLRNAISVKKRFGGELCVKIDQVTNGSVKRHWLRPDIWPEQVELEGGIAAKE